MTGRRTATDAGVPAMEVGTDGRKRKEESAPDDPLRTVRAGRASRRQADRRDRQLADPGELQAAAGSGWNQGRLDRPRVGQGIKSFHSFDAWRRPKSIGTAFFKHVEPVDGKFGNYAFEAGKNGAPIISEAPAAVECKVVGFHELGDHSVVIGEVTEGHLKRESEPLTLKECGFNYGG
jgi:flavin reductase like protein